jgi:sugar phosphate permease
MCPHAVVLQVVMVYTVGIALALLTMQYVPAANAALQWFNVFMIGFFLYGPQMLIGLCGAELVGPDSVGASEGFLGWIAYLGEFTGMGQCMVWGYGEALSLSFGEL